MSIAKATRLIVCAGMLFVQLAHGMDREVVAGPAYARFSLTLSHGNREEMAGPLYYSQQAAGQDQWALPPLMCYTRSPDVDWTELEILYPVLTYRRFGSEYRGQFFQLFSYSGGAHQEGAERRRTTVFPFYFQQRSPDHSQDYTALFPFYGHVVNRLLRDDIRVVMFPLYSETRKKDVVTDNYLFPLFDRRRGNGLSGWQFWPVVGAEQKVPTMRTNSLDELETVGGHEHFFVLWPFFLKGREGIGTTNEERRLTILPFYDRLRSPSRDEKSLGWPLGVCHIEDREKKFTEHDALWPLFVHAWGTKNVRRYFPFYSRASNGDLESDFYLWPVYKINRLHAPPLERERKRILFFLYSDTVQKNTQTKEATRRTDFWPFFTFKREMDGSERLQALAVLEPFFPNNRSIPREYGPVYSLWRAETNSATKGASQSLLWNLYRREAVPASKKISLLFGLFQYESDAGGSNWRVCYFHLRKKKLWPVEPSS